ncbi:MAG: SMC family ATPase, partial [Ruminococcus sp.]|nr:SMC family ATPase [Ruminococcus sp.]
MKPLAITIQAFGSYVFQTIDFTKLTQNLFLVTGDTGAGKSTIFDAVVFALYGGTGSEINKKAYEDMWSQYAEDGQKPFVELTFSEKNGGNDEIFKVKRSLSRSSANKFSQKVTLTKLPEDKDFKGTNSEINEKIEKIIGLSKSQFMQVAMIAQGEFMELIRIDDSKDKDKKKAVFRKLFRTDIYEKIISELKKRKDIKDGEVSEIRAECRSLVTRTESGDNAEIKELQKRIISEKIPSYSDIAEFKTRLEFFNADIGKNFESAKKVAEKSRADYEKAHDSLVRAVETKEHFDKLAQAERVLSELKKSEGDIKKSEELMKKIISAYEIK